MKAGRSLTELATELERQSATKADYVAPASLLKVETAAGKTVLQMGEAKQFTMQDTAHEQLAPFLEIPKVYYDRMRSEAPALYDSNVNHWLHGNTTKRMVRTLDGKARAFLSERYRPLDNDDLAEAVLPSLISQGFEVVSAQITDRKFYLKAVTPRISGEVKRGDVVQMGIAISNSEVGQGSLRIDPLLYFLACLNGAIREDSRVKKYHIGRANDVDSAMELYRSDTRQATDRAFWMQIRDIMATVATQEWLNGQIERLGDAATQEITADPIQVVEVTAKKYRLNDGERNSVLRHFLGGHNGQAELTQYGLMQAITRASQDVEDYDRATELEHLGGHIVELPRLQWESLASARL